MKREYVVENSLKKKKKLNRPTDAHHSGSIRKLKKIGIEGHDIKLGMFSLHKKEKEKRWLKRRSFWLVFARILKF